MKVMALVGGPKDNPLPGASGHNFLVYSPDKGTLTGALDRNGLAYASGWCAGC